MKILYGVSGEGMGHAARSKTILTELKKQHKIKVVAGGRAYQFLKKHFNTSRIGFFKIIYRNNSVTYLLTFFYNLLKFPFIFLYNLKFIPIILKFKPDIIITDVELFSCYLSILFNKKSISIDNQHIINTNLNKNLFFEKLIIKSLIPKADHYLVTTFFYPPIQKKNTFLFPPINTQEVINASPQNKDYILVYQTSKSNKKLIPTLNSINQNFIVYGFDKDKQIKNVKLKKFNEKEFIKDLINCKAVITNGGFTLIGEALYLRKPILSIPIKKQFEQITNAVYLKKLGYGMYCRETSKRNIQKFLSNLKKYRNNLKKYKKQDNSKIFKKLKQLLQ
ncbi:hypothetical protein KY332_03295 [Candidatus Woesearchaeota archaeon]|nr:hypothetical protein [Candidatus Woesearchaeota archaeon]